MNIYEKNYCRESLHRSEDYNKLRDFTDYHIRENEQVRHQVRSFDSSQFPSMVAGSLKDVKLSQRRFEDSLKQLDCSLDMGYQE